MFESTGKYSKAFDGWWERLALFYEMSAAKQDAFGIKIGEIVFDQSSNKILLLKIEDFHRCGFSMTPSELSKNKETLELLEDGVNKIFEVFIQKRGIDAFMKCSNTVLVNKNKYIGCSGVQTLLREFKLALELEIIKKSCLEAFNCIVCSNDIIPRAKIPFIYNDQLEEYQRIFGEVRMQEMMAYFKKTAKIRELVKNIPEEITYPTTTKQVLITMFGVGECHEMASRVLVELIKNGYENSIHMVVTSRKVNAYTNKPYSHVFLILNHKDTIDLNKDDNIMEFLSQESDQTIIIEPFLKILAYNNAQARKTLKEYLAPSKSYKVSGKTSSNKVNADIEVLSKNVQKWYKKLVAQIQNTPGDSSIVFNSIFNENNTP